jgi:hypothetical protein
MRRSFVSRQREISCRFSRRSSSRVMSGSRVIIRFAISPHGSPAGAPRRIRSTLYWVGDRSSDFKNWAGPRESRSQVRSRSRNAASSGVPRAFFVSFIIIIDYICYNDIRPDTYQSQPRGCEIQSGGPGAKRSSVPNWHGLEFVLLCCQLSNRFATPFCHPSSNRQQCFSHFPHILDASLRTHA